MTDIIALEAVETMRINLPAIIDGVRGSISCDLSLDSIDAWSCRLLKDAGIRLEVIGRERITQGDNYIVMSNHYSQYDLPVLYRALGMPLRLVETNQMFRIPFLAMLSGMRILPVAIDGPAAFPEFEKDQEYTITVTIGEPLDPITYGPQQIDRLICIVRDVIERNLLPLQRLRFFNSRIWPRRPSIRKQEPTSERNLPSLVFSAASNPVPEPASMLLLGTGITGLSSMLRRKREL